MNEKYLYREKLLTDAVSLSEPDRVPVVPLIATYPLFEYGYSFKQNMYDPDSCFDAFLQYHREFEQDAAFGNPCIHSGKALDLVGPKHMRYPGKTGGLADDAPSYQYTEDLFPLIREGEWEEVLNNRTQWFITKYLPRKFRLFEPLAEMDLDYTTFQSYAGLGMLADQALKPVFEKLTLALNESHAYMMSILRLGIELTKMGYPGMIGGSLMVPFDMVGDMALGTQEGMTSLLEYPEELLELTEKVTEDIARQARLTIKQDRPVKRIWFYMHKGMDGFMNDEQYRKYYFEPLLKIIKILTDAGYTPILQCQGKYHTRLDYLAELPKGKCICFFERTDMEEAKKKLEGNVCIGGNLSASLLQFGTKEDVIKETKRQIDNYAKGGGYIFSTDATIDYAKRENIEAMLETALFYGMKR